MLTQGEAGSDALARPKHQLTPERSWARGTGGAVGANAVQVAVSSGARWLGGKRRATARAAWRRGERQRQPRRGRHAHVTPTRALPVRCLAGGASHALRGAREAGRGARLGNAGVCAAARARLPSILPPPSAPSSPPVAMRLFVLLPLLLLFASLVAAAQWSKEDVEVRRRCLHARHSHS